MSTITWEYDKKAKAAFTGGFVNAETLGGLLKEILDTSIGPGRVMHMHLRKGQGQWRRPSQRTLRDRRKKDKRTFVFSGRVEKAISTRVNKGEITTWGSSADIYSTVRTKAPKRYSANGVYASAKIRPNEASLTIGFSGTMKHSAAFNKRRRELAIERGADLRGKSSRERDEIIRKLVSVGDVERRFGGSKWSSKGSLGFSGGRHRLARGANNLAYANIVQRGVFKGITTKKGQLINPKGLAAARRRGVFNTGTKTFGTARPLMPYLPEDEAALMAVINTWFANLCRRLS